MPPTDADDRLLAALRGAPTDAAPGPDADREQSELDIALDLGRIARQADLGNAESDIDDEVPDSQWAAIEAQLREGDTTPDLRVVPAIDADPLADLGTPEIEAPVGPVARSTTSGLDASPPASDPNVVSLGRAARSGGRGMRTWLPSVAAAVIAIAAGAWFLTGDRSPEPIDEIALDQLMDAGAATAEIRESEGGLEIAVAVDGVDPADGYFELWLLNAEASELVSLGPLRADGVYPLPAGLDPAAFPVVDVSVEAFDGNPAHSGESVFRGTFEI
ncbi:MAG: anti-sigma factor [Actinomycetota bacterium]